MSDRLERFSTNILDDDGVFDTRDVFDVLPRHDDTEHRHPYRETSILRRLALAVAISQSTQPALENFVAAIENEYYITTMTLQQNDNIIAEFRRLVDLWRTETQFLSSSQQIIGHPAYQKIISLGNKAVPLIIREMMTDNGPWAYALTNITGENPVSPEDRGKATAVTRAWLKWAEQHKIC